MVLLTSAIKKRLEKFDLYSQDGKGDNAEVICKFFFGCFTWYVLEGRQEGGDYTFYGIVDNARYGEHEYGYFSLRDLESITYMGIKAVERDRYFEPCKVKDLEFSE